tara:strand:- start:12812 stop:13087 length:276 start_codon:yes stop_codon:yes gene_type:complete
MSRPNNYPQRLTFEIKLPGGDTHIYKNHADVIIRSWRDDGTMSIESVSAVAARHQWKEWVRKGFSRNDEPKEHLESIHCDGVDQKFSKLSP